jgi:hypothetical protein
MQDAFPYPPDLVNGAIPVVFAVNAVDSKYVTSPWSSSTTYGSSLYQEWQKDDVVGEAVPQEGNNKTGGNIGTSAPSCNGPFDLFIDAMSLMCNKDSYKHVDRWSSVSNNAGRVGADSAPSDLLLSGGQQYHDHHNELYSREIISGEESSTDEDDDGNTHLGKNDDNDETRRIRHGFASEMRKRINYINRSTAKASTNTKDHPQKSLHQQQRAAMEDVGLQQSTSTPTMPAFFDRVRIIPVSKRHAFPPSKDPNGVNNTIILPGMSSTTNIHHNHQQQQQNQYQRYPYNYNATTHDTNASVSAATAASKYQQQPVEQFLLDKISPNPFSLRRKQLHLDRAITALEPSKMPPPSSSSTFSTHGDSMTIYPPTDAINTTSSEGSHLNKYHNNVGIIPLDWLEKHCQWLPSVVLVVMALDLNLPQTLRVERDVQLGETIDNIRSSLAPKRECRIHLVCLVTNHEQLKTIQQKHLATSQQLTFVRSQCRLSPSNITMLYFPGDLVVGEQQSNPQLLTTIPKKLPLLPSQPSLTTTTTTTLINELSLTSLPLKQLYRTTRDLSLSYYLTAARRLKRKISLLHSYDNNSTMNYNLLPFIIRYQFKISIYYEFQLKLDRSFKHLSEAYNAAELYYKYITNQQRQVLSVLQEQIYYYSQQHMRKQNILDQVVEDEECGSSEAFHDNSGGGNNMYPTSYADLSTPVTPQRKIAKSKIQSPNTTADDGVEVALIIGSPPSNAVAAATSNADSDHEDLLLMKQQFKLLPLSDMAFQCRGVADWINFKLMKYTFKYSSSNTTQQQIAPDADKSSITDIKGVGGGAGIVHATMQWRRHSQVFLSAKYYHAYDNIPKISNCPLLLQPKWWHSSYVEHQRLAIAELAERYPLLLHNVDSTFASRESLFICASWRLYLAAAEATLQTCKLIEFENQSKNLTHQYDQVDEDTAQEQHYSASQYVGGIDPGMLENQFRKETRKQHCHSALRFLERAISLFYNPDGQNRISWYDCTLDNHEGRLAAPLHYLFGSLSMNKVIEEYGDSNDYNTISTGLETAMKHLHHALGLVVGWSTLEAAIAKTLIRCYSKLTELGIVWDHAMLANALTFLLFPDIYQFLQAMEVQQLHDGLLSLKHQPHCFSIPWPKEERKRSPLDFSLTFLDGACNAIAGDKVMACLSITSQCNFPVVIHSLQIVLSTSDSQLVVTANLPEREDDKIRVRLLPRKSHCFEVAIHVPHMNAKNSVESHSSPLSRSSKTKTAGLTRSGGAVIAAQRNGAPSTNQTVYSGISLLCHDLSILLTPEVCDQSSRNGIAVKLMLSSCRSDIFKHIPDAARVPENKLARHHPDDGNYIASAWSRPSNVPFYRGPSYLRILPPISGLKVKDLTAIQTNSNAMDGTINRIYLELKAGEMEHCKNINMKLNSLQTSSLPDSMMVVETAVRASSVRAQTNVIPFGWRLRDSEDITLVCDDLKPGDDTLVMIDFFRPLPHAPYNAANLSLLTPSETHYELQFTYTQLRPGNFDTKGDTVTMCYSGMLKWFAPVNVQFNVIPDMNEKCFPRGSPHSSILSMSQEMDSGIDGANQAAINDSTVVRRGKSDTEPHVFAADGDLVTVRGNLVSSHSQTILVTDIHTITFEVRNTTSLHLPENTHFSNRITPFSFIFRPKESTIKLASWSSFHLQGLR